jgi:diguanylate cyclase (GGDEF)-like protein
MVVKIQGNKVGSIMHDRDYDKLAREYVNEARQAFYDKKLDYAMLLGQNALHLYKKSGNTEQYAVTLNLLGVIYAALGNDMTAVDYYLEGLECALEHQFNRLLTLFYNNIGTRYQELGEHRQAIQYFLKATEWLQESGDKEQHDRWALVTYLNLMESFLMLDNLEEAETYRKLVEPLMETDAGKDYKYTFLIAKCRLFWQLGKKDYVYEHMDELLASGVDVINTSDHVQNMTGLCALLKHMEAYKEWETINKAFEKYAEEQNSVYFQMIKTEMWMDYYKTINQTERYVQLCVEHAELHQQQKRLNDKERATAIDLKIELQEKEEKRKEAERKSIRDALTGLGNRYMLAMDLANYMEKAGTNDKHIAVGLVDIDCFKHLNDTYGHITGDICLRAVAKVLEEAVGNFGTVYRYGGDEFVIFMLLEDDGVLEQVAQNIIESLKKQEIHAADATLITELTVSQGYVFMKPESKMTGVQLVECADNALYFVKEHGRNGYHIIRE